MLHNTFPALDPLTSPSYYVYYNDISPLGKEGCALGKRDLQTYKSGGGHTHSIVILDFGYPAWVNSSWGAQLLGGAYVDGWRIPQLASEFGYWYWICTGEDLDSTIEISVGVNNYPRHLSTSSDLFWHGYYWSNVVSDVESIISDRGAASQVWASGAIDMEPSWHNPSASRAWVDGFAANPYYQRFYDFGSADGCPPSGGPGCNNGWTPADVHYVSWGAYPAFAFPEIYNDAMAQQWDYLSLNYGNFISGVLTQFQACNDVQPGGAKCSGMYNDPGKGYAQLNERVKARQGNIYYGSDIMWQYKHKCQNSSGAYDGTQC